MSDADLITFHQDEDYFREALEFSAAETGFPARLVEKDYYCTLLLQYLMKADAEMIFKGGTCLAKVHADFYRLSEDLDFSIPMPFHTTRAQRSKRVQGLKTTIQRAEEELPKVGVRTPMTGANRSTQYSAILVYASALVTDEEAIKIEVGLREPLLTASLRGEARTLLLDPITESPLVPALVVDCLSWKEAMAEKLRAALSRREAAVRDFYDIYYAVKKLGLSILEPGLVGLVKAKLAVPGNEPVDLSDDRLESLLSQVDTELKPVLRPEDFAEFDLVWTFTELLELAAALD